VDIIEGPLLEYAAVWRGLYYLLMGFLSFTLSSLFVTLFVGIPFDVRFPFVMLLHLILVVILPVCSAVLRAFSPVFTFKQIYFVSFTSTMLGVIALVLSAMGV
jgi:energy-converting hydrogenase B subunit O